MDTQKKEKEDEIAQKKKLIEKTNSEEKLMGAKKIAEDEGSLYSNDDGSQDSELSEHKSNFESTECFANTDERVNQEKVTCEDRVLLKRVDRSELTFEKNNKVKRIAEKMDEEELTSEKLIAMVNFDEKKTKDTLIVVKKSEEILKAKEKYKEELDEKKKTEMELIVEKIAEELYDKKSTEDQKSEEVGNDEITTDKAEDQKTLRTADGNKMKSTKANDAHKTKGFGTRKTEAIRKKEEDSQMAQVELKAKKGELKEIKVKEVHQAKGKKKPVSTLAYTSRVCCNIC